MFFSWRPWCQMMLFSDSYPQTPTNDHQVYKQVRRRGWCLDWVRCRVAIKHTKANSQVPGISTVHEHMFLQDSRWFITGACFRYTWIQYYIQKNNWIVAEHQWRKNMCTNLMYLSKIDKSHKCYFKFQKQKSLADWYHICDVFNLSWLMEE